jgi:hypothetical protein
MKAAALMVFTVGYAGIRLKVRVLPHAKDVYMECTGAKKWRMRAELPRAFFRPSIRSKKYTGTVVFAGNDRLAEIVPHEVTHAVLHKMGCVDSRDDEAFATAVGMLSARILRKIEQGGIHA